VSGERALPAAIPPFLLSVGSPLERKTPSLPRSSGTLYLFFPSTSPPPLIGEPSPVNHYRYKPSEISYTRHFETRRRPSIRPVYGTPSTRLFISIDVFFSESERVSLPPKMNYWCQQRKFPISLGIVDFLQNRGSVSFEISQFLTSVRVTPLLKIEYLSPPPL